MIYVLVAVILFNLIMWIIMGVKFNKFFSTDKFIEESREQVNDMITSINRNASRNIEILNDKIKQLKAISAEAEHNIQLLKNELIKSEKSKIFQQELASYSIPKTSSSLFDEIQNPQNLIKENKINSKKNMTLLEEFAQADIIEENKSKKLNKIQKIPANSKASLTNLYEKNKNFGQEELFSSQNLEETQKFNAEMDLVQKMQEADKALSVAQEQKKKIPQFYVSNNPIKTKKDFSKIVKDLNDLGFSAEEIANKTARSVQEIKLALEFL